MILGNLKRWRHIRRASQLLVAEGCRRFHGSLSNFSTSGTLAVDASAADASAADASTLSDEASTSITTPPPPPLPHNFLDVSPLAEKLRADIRNYTTWHNGIKLAGVLAGDSEDAAAASTYSDRIAETFFQDGLEYELVQCANNVLHRSTVAQVIQQLNARRDVHGILVFYPIFATDSHHHHHHHHQQQHKTYLNRLNGTYYKTDDDYLRDCVHPAKDVEGLHGGTNARHLFRARARRRPLADDVYVPCTALAVQKILEAYHFLGTVSGIDYCPTADAFRTAITWSEPFIVGLLTFQVFIFLCTIYVCRKDVSLAPRIILMVLIAALVRSAEYLNGWAARSWEEWGITQNYFDPRGIFVSIFLCAPLLVDSFIMLIAFLRESSTLLVQVKTAELKQKRKQKKKQEASGNPKRRGKKDQ